MGRIVVQKPDLLDFSPLFLMKHLRRIESFSRHFDINH